MLRPLRRDARLGGNEPEGLLLLLALVGLPHLGLQACKPVVH